MIVICANVYFHFKSPLKASRQDKHYHTKHIQASLFKCLIMLTTDRQTSKYFVFMILAIGYLLAFLLVILSSQFVYCSFSLITRYKGI